jgi:hypothetical protein
MTQQNRVDPWGALHAVPSRGNLMGNRGILHNDEGEIVRKWASPTWVTCVLKFGQRTSPGTFRPGHYSKLFFLDEATAFAAGHRPCGECQRPRYMEFRDAWKAANVSEEQLERFSLSMLDRQLHAERTSRTATNGKGTFTAPISELPFGVLVEWAGHAWLVANARELRRWSFDGYAPPVEAPAEAVRVLTPASIVKTFGQGFRPRVHSSGL